MTFACETMPKGIPAQIAADFAARVPVLETPRLSLRAPRPADFPLYADILCSPRGKHLGGPYKRDEAWWDFVQLASGWMLHGHGGWTIETHQGAVVGFALIGMEPGDQEPELGYLLVENAQGKGYATEAAQAAKTFAFQHLKMTTLVSYIDIGNARSERVAERLGAVKEGTLSYDGDHVHIYRHPNSSEAH